MNLPNKISIARICMIPLFIVFAFPYTINAEASGLWGTICSFMNSYGLTISAVIFFAASATDALDGYIARKYKLVTNLGKFLDPVADKLLVMAALIVLVQRGMVSSIVVILILGREFIVTFIRLLAAGGGKVISAGIFGKIKTNVQIVAIIVALLNDFPFSLFLNDFKVYNILMWAAAVVTVLSGFDYIKRNIEFLRE